MSYGMNGWNKPDGDLISRAAAIDKLRSNIPYMQVFGCDRSITLIKELPSAQPERKKGRWTIKQDDVGGVYGECSACGMKDYAGLTFFCPNCGAKMEVSE